MKVYLATAYPTPWTYLPRFRNLSSVDRFKVHILTPDPATADIILFVDARAEHGDWTFRTLRNHPLVQKWPEKCFVYDETDQPWCYIPGLYVSMPAGDFDQRRMRAVSYQALPNPRTEVEAAAIDHAKGPDLLFSFIGRRCVAVRETILSLRHRRAIVEDSSSYNYFGDPSQPSAKMDAQSDHFARTTARSKFVLCPRGSGTASFRLFEALAAGRVPVILSDDWVPPMGPDWSKCALRIPEAEASSVSQILEASEERWDTMASAAKAAWNEWFAENVVFHRFIEACRELKDNRRALPERLIRRMPSRRFLRLWLRHVKGRIAARFRRRLPSGIDSRYA